MMKLGMITDFKEDAYKRAQSKGLEFVEFCVNANESDYHQEFAAKAPETKNKLEALGLFTGSVGRWGANKIKADGSINEEELKADALLIEAASKLQCHVYVTNCNYNDSISLFANYDMAIKYFEKLLALGKEHGVAIATNNCRWNNFVTSDPAWSVIHGHLPELKIKFDPSHCAYDGGDYLAEMHKWGHRFEHVHIKGVLQAAGERVDDPPAGLDTINWGAFMSALYAVGYDKTLAIEPHSGVWTGELGEKGLDFTIKMMKTLIF